MLLPLPAVLVLVLVSLPGSLSAQLRAQVASQAETDTCRIGLVGVARSGIGFVCDRGTDGPVLIVVSGAEGEGNARLVHEWATRSAETGSTRVAFTVRHRAPSPGAQAVCDQFALPGSNARDPAPMRCRELEVAYRG